MAIENDLISLATKINQSTDMITNSLKNAEQLWRELNFGFHAWTPNPILHEQSVRCTEDFENVDCIRSVYLGWCRMPLSWGLALREEYHEILEFDDEGHPTETREIESKITPLLTADRNKRFLAYEHLDVLEKQVAIEGNKFLEKVDAIRKRRTAKATSETLEALKSM